MAANALSYRYARLAVGCVGARGKRNRENGAKCLLRYLRWSFNLRELCSQIKLVWVDGGYRGDELKHFVRRLWGWCWQVVLRTDDTKGFKVLPRRWVVERTFAWILHARRLSKDYEKNRTNAQSMVYLAMISIWVKRL